MNPEFNDQHEETQLTDTVSFNELRTIPENWDVSAFVPNKNPNPNGAADSPAEAADQISKDDQDSGSTSWCPESFPQPRTIPGKWDISGLK